jgi:hypothetical protein
MSSEHPAPQQYPQAQDHRAPPTDYGMAPNSARSGTFPEYLQHQQRPQPYTPGQGPPTGGLPQPTSPSMPLQTIASANSQHRVLNDHEKSNEKLPIDPSITTSPTYPPQASPYSPYNHPDMQHYAAGAPGVYGRPEWAAHGHYSHGQHPIPHYGHPASTGPPSAGLVSPVHRPPVCPDSQKENWAANTYFLGSASIEYCVFVRPNPRRPAAQTSPKAL